jgi:hypothetical protein
MTLLSGVVACRVPATPSTESAASVCGDNYVEFFRRALATVRRSCTVVE